MKTIKTFEAFNEQPIIAKPVSEETPVVAEAYQFDFEDWDDTDISGMGMEMAMEQLIEETKALIEKEVDLNLALVPVEMRLQTKKDAAKEIKRLWLHKLEDLKF